MKRIFYLAVVCCMIINIAFAQNRISSTVIDGISKKPLIGASIINGTVKTVTNSNGEFNIPCSSDNIKITISYIGYQTYSTTIKNCKIDKEILLNPAETTLETIELGTTSNPNKSLLYQAGAVSKIGVTELRRGNGLYLDDAIQTNVTGVTMNRRSVGGGQQLNIRGYGNGTRGTRGVNSNFDGQGYKVYLNGIAITDAEGITTFDDIDFASLQNVEITKGPSGTLYGLAIAGAVNLTTSKPAKETSLTQQYIIGNYGLNRSTTTFQTAGEHSSMLLNYGNQQSDGFTLHNKSNKQFVNLIADFQPSEKQTINTYFGYSDSYDERAGELTITQFENNDYSGNPEYIKRNAHSNVTTFRGGLGHHFSINKNISSNTTVFGTAFNSNVSSAGGWTDKGSMNMGFRSVLNTKFIVAEGIILAGVTGIESQKQIANTLGYNMKQNPNDAGTTWTLGINPYWVINATTSNVYTVAKTTSLFSEWTLGLPKEISITGGLGSSQLGLTLNDRLNVALSTKPSNFEKSYRKMVSPHFAINKVIHKKISVFASYNKGFKAPLTSYFYITTPAVATNPPTPATGSVNDLLKPEIGTQFEIGNRGQLLKNKLFYELVLFSTVFSNKMTAISVVSPLSPNTTLYSYVVNGGKQIHRGLEANLKFIAYEKAGGFFRYMRPFGNLTISDFKYGDNFSIQKSVTLTENYSNKQVAAVSRYVANLGVDFNIAGGYYGNITYNYRDRMPITGMNDYFTKSYNLLNGKIGYQHDLGKHFVLDSYLGINNITNTKYFTMVFANQLPDAYVPAPLNANYFVSIQLKYTF